MLFKNVILVYQLSENCLKQQICKRNLIMECTILPLLNANMFREQEQLLLVLHALLICNLQPIPNFSNASTIFLEIPLHNELSSPFFRFERALLHIKIVGTFLFGMHITFFLLTCNHFSLKPCSCKKSIIMSIISFIRPLDILQRKQDSNPNLQLIANLLTN